MLFYLQIGQILNVEHYFGFKTISCMCLSQIRIFSNLITKKVTIVKFFKLWIGKFQHLSQYLKLEILSFPNYLKTFIFQFKKRLPYNYILMIKIQQNFFVSQLDTTVYKKAIVNSFINIFNHFSSHIWALM